MRRLDPPESSSSDIEPDDTTIKNAIRPSARKLTLRHTMKYPGHHRGTRSKLTEGYDV